eukprot:Rmarinus@m.10749
MAVPYEEAMSILVSMFGTQFDREIIDEVLRAYQGHMENTVEALLQMSGEAVDAPPPPNAQPPTAPAPAPTPPASYHQPTGQPYVPGYSAPLPQAASHQPPHPHTQPPVQPSVPSGQYGSLPDDFLRLPGDTHQTHAPAQGGHVYRSAEEERQIKGDEEFARMLQDELFMNSLHEHPEWLNAIENGGRLPAGAPTSHMPPQSSQETTNAQFDAMPMAPMPVATRGTGAAVAAGGDTHGNLKDRFESFSSGAKSRLQQFYHSFRKSGNRSGYYQTTGDEFEMIQYENEPDLRRRPDSERTSLREGPDARAHDNAHVPSHGARHGQEDELRRPSGTEEDPFNPERFTSRTNV